MLLATSVLTRADNMSKPGAPASDSQLAGAGAQSLRLHLIGVSGGGLRNEVEVTVEAGVNPSMTNHFSAFGILGGGLRLEQEG
jgi:hypothetical protein